MAVTEGDLAQQEVVLELGPLRAGRGPQFAARSGGTATFEEVLVCGDDLLREHSGVAAGGVQVEVPEQGRGDAQSSPVDTISVVNTSRKS